MICCASSWQLSGLLGLTQWCLALLHKGDGSQWQGRAFAESRAFIEACSNMLQCLSKGKALGVDRVFTAAKARCSL